MLVVHPHFHHRPTGVTTHTGAIVAALQAHAEVKWTGRLLPEVRPRTALGEDWRRARTEPVIWHAHRNNELLLGLWLRVFRPKLKVELVVPTSLVPRLLDVLRRAVGTGRIGDGKIFVTPVEEAIRVRTGENGDGAL